MTATATRAIGQRAREAVPDRRVRACSTASPRSSPPSIAASTGQLRARARRPRRRWSQNVVEPRARYLLEARRHACPTARPSSTAARSPSDARQAGPRLQRRRRRGRRRRAARSRRLRHRSTRATLAFTLADRAHARRRAGAGSGADVAAAVHGGVIHYARRDGARRRAAAALPAAVELIVFSTGTPSSTVDHVRGARGATRRATPRRTAGTHATRSRAPADDFMPRAVEATTRARSSRRRHARTPRSRRSGHDIGLPIVTPALAEAGEAGRGAGRRGQAVGRGRRRRRRRVSDRSRSRRDLSRSARHTSDSKSLV